ncbi:hypothetical protein Cgig2_031625 [Carnegiea gigantea]|uniref:peroxidase n=1 Tax=Carnegiea gigantea TaxID=171969 RepID=A0A9Q1QFI7_9CARY|nr:hypothetical protein Cgig2_031625 [Carnegiea gigantea]
MDLGLFLMIHDSVADLAGRLRALSQSQTMDKTLVSKLKRICKSSTNANRSAFLDQNTLFVLYNEYYNQIKNKRGLLKTDQGLALDSLSSNVELRIVANNAFFKQSFVKVITEMESIQRAGSWEKSGKSAREQKISGRGDGSESSFDAIKVVQVYNYGLLCIPPDFVNDEQDKSYHDLA